MNNFKKYHLILFDFHKTLTDTDYFNRLNAQLRETISDLVFRPPNNELWDKRWMVGQISYLDVLGYIADEIKLDQTFLEEELLKGLQEIEWNKRIWDFSQSVRKHTKTAIASINTDLFNRFVIPRYNLTDRFDAIANSYDLGEISKAKICISAAKKLGFNLQEHQILLIDDKQENIDEFVAAGGVGYCFQSDDSFQEWIAGER